MAFQTVVTTCICTCGAAKVLKNETGDTLGEYHLYSCEIEGETHIRYFNGNPSTMERFVRVKETKDATSP
jgi:hypothetical protein